MIRRNAARLERRQGGARPIEVVHAPAPEPRAVGFLFGQQVAEAARHGVRVALLMDVLAQLP